MKNYYGAEYLSNINFLAEFKKLNNKKDLNKMKQEVWEKEINKIITDIPRPNTAEDLFEENVDKYGW
ncbi:hypothetical protein MBCUT_08760 [Methanobrevibacter cuticularis]|uniref:Uncharacterized protein n=1 Tax=Methanobrevibacter cuticularis TaxID=47311 RepID=A0A166E8C3_9EURY|nr:hypothetical protein [Methanobrevibacter cuticularis]KZX16384.1 hypothetical protein MBCUT_08760 [Methanobrevibacter cuticularis]